MEVLAFFGLRQSGFAAGTGLTKASGASRKVKKHTPAFDVLQCDLPDEYCSSLPFLEEGVWGEMNGSLD
jgi:hypothetical protein